jgi:Family of unknown function (DUF6459)
MYHRPYSGLFLSAATRRQTTLEVTMPKRSAVRRPSPLRLIPYGEHFRAEAVVNGSLALALDSDPPPGRALRPVLGVVRDGRSGLPTEARLIARLVLDVLTGARPYHHLAGRTTPELFERLQPLVARLSGASATLGTVRICAPAPGVAEVAVVARVGTRVQALALRLEHHRRWRCAAIETTVPS